MLLVLHIIIALSSVLYTTYLYTSPTKSHFYKAYALVGLTLGSGTYLVLSSHAKIVQSCLSGIAYLGVVLLGIALARRRLAADRSLIKKN